ncbi:MAG: TRAP transporter substrate-binding protein [Pseudomonadales bacterium]|nr:TRAP transporter substrate-binding protein [Pseudomonadales bacterium]
MGQGNEGFFLKKISAFMKNTLACVIFFSLLGCGADKVGNVDQLNAESQQKIYRWKLITTWPKNLPGLGTAPVEMAKRVAAMSGGRLDIKVYAAGELVPAFGVFDAVSQGNAQMGHGAAYYWRGKIPIAAMFATVPFGLLAQEMNAWLHYGGGLELWREAYAPFNLRPLTGGNSGMQMAGWFNREIKSLADIQGLKMRIPGLGGEVFQRAGGVAVAMPGSEVFTAMQTGVIDATEWVGPYNDIALGLHTVGKYYYYPGWHEPGSALETIINQDAWDELPEDLQLILETANQAMNQAMLDEFTARNAISLRTLVDEHGVIVKKLPDDVLQAFREISEQVVFENAQSDELSKRIYKSYAEFKNRMTAYQAIADQAYINVR